MKKLRWATDGNGEWELDMSTPVTLEGEARAVPGSPHPLPLGGLTRGTSLSRPTQLHFFQRFMAAPFLPSFSPASHGLSLQRVLSFPLSSSPSPNWFATLLGQFNVQKFVSSLMEIEGGLQPSQSSPLQRIRRHLCDKSLYALGFGSDISLTPEDKLLLSFDVYGENHSVPRKKAVFHHELPHHNLTMEAVWPGLFVDKSGNYWDVPFSMAIDLASVGFDCGASYHLCMQHKMGMPKPFGVDQSLEVPHSLLPGTSVKSAFSFKKNFEIWRSKAQKLKMVQPFDMLLSNPHISASGIIGAAVTASLGDNSSRSHNADSHGFQGLFFHSPAVKSALLADMFSSVSFTAQHGSFQRKFLDLSRLNIRLDFLSGSKLVSGITQLAQDYFYSKEPAVESFQAVCPEVTISLQQQIAGPFSLRVDSGVAIDWKNRYCDLHLRESVFAIEYALQVLGSAKAVAWYSPKHQEFMVELRFLET